MRVSFLVCSCAKQVRPAPADCVLGRRGRRVTSVAGPCTTMRHGRAVPKGERTMTSETSPVAPVPRRYEAVPGPRGWPLLGVAPRLRREAFHRQLEGWAREYGDIFAFRLGSRRFLAVTDPEVIASVLRRRPGAFRRGTRLEQVSREMGFLGLFSANGETWRRQRPMVLHGLDPTHIRSYLPAMVEITERLKRRWTEAATQGREIDLSADLMRYTVDVTTCLAFGHNLNTLEASAETAIQQHLNVILPALFKRLLAPF